ncbi:uncharacterized protein LOC131858318 [Cryptomeria japonica]|uniref:uncharacterized protein LOC131858318 n=1 Tax=Cryptomeria japonica TaxID=3369 RepID=UPI0027DA2D65|nr:uncharacterized protein LOC131858318 [Cryptomeria japonica]
MSDPLYKDELKPSQLEDKQGDSRTQKVETQSDDQLKDQGKTTLGVDTNDNPPLNDANKKEDTRDVAEKQVLDFVADESVKEKDKSIEAEKKEEEKQEELDKGKSKATETPILMAIDTSKIQSQGSFPQFNISFDKPFN